MSFGEGGLSMSLFIDGTRLKSFLLWLENLVSGGEAEREKCCELTLKA